MKRHILILLLLATVLATKAASWELKPWQVYLIEQRVKADTAACTASIMVPQAWSKGQLKAQHFTFPTYYVVEPKTMFEQWEDLEERERIDRYGYHMHDFVVDMMWNVLETIIFK